MTHILLTLACAALLLLIASASAQSGGDVIQACTAQSLTRGAPCQSFTSSGGTSNKGICQLGTVCSHASSGDRDKAQSGTCATRPVVGDACTASVPCFDPVYNVTCRRGMCVYHNFLVAGEACNLNDPSFFNGGCAESLTCTNGVCGPAVAVGAQCMTGAWSCAAGAYCNPTSGRSGAQLQGVCTAFVATDGACTANVQCAPGNVCLQQIASSGGRQQRVCTSIADISTSAFIGQQLQLLNSTDSLALPSTFLQACAYSFDCQLGFRCVCNATQNVCVRVNNTAFIQSTLEWLSCVQANGCPDPLRFEPGAKITFGPGSCWETHCCQQTAAYFGVTNPKCPAAATSAPGTGR